MRIFIAGATGVIGIRLLPLLVAGGSARVIAQSISWELPDGARSAVAAAHERAVLQAGGVVIRYGQLSGPGTYYPYYPAGPPARNTFSCRRRSCAW